jgi:hypothetical protein
MPIEDVNPGEIEIVGQGEDIPAGTEIDLDAMTQRPGGVQEGIQGQEEEGGFPEGDPELPPDMQPGEQQLEQPGQSPGQQPEPWKDAIGGVATEFRRHMDQQNQQIQYMMQMVSGMMKNNQQQQPSNEPKTEPHPFDDPLNLAMEGMDPKMVRWLHDYRSQTATKQQQLEERITQLVEGMEQEKRGNQMASYYQSQLDQGLNQHSLDPESRRFLEPMLLGMALTSKGGPYSVNVGSVVEGFAKFLKARDTANEQAWKKKYSQTASAQQRIPAPPGKGAQTTPKPANRGSSPTNMDEMDAMWDSLAQRHSG